MARQAPIGHRIRGRRKDMGMTQTALAGAAGISASYLNLIEHNRRAIGGGLLLRLAEALQIHPSTLSGSEESRLLSDLGELASDPVFRDTPLDRREFSSVISAGPGVVNAMLQLYRAYRSTLDDVDMLSERLSHDPYLTEASHSILTRITSIRTVAEIFEHYDDLSAAQRDRFNATLVRESERLAESATEIFSFLERGAAGRPAANPSEEVDDLLYDNANHFPILEDCAETLRAGIDRSGGLFLTDLINHLQSRHSVTVERLRPEDLPATGHIWDGKNRRLQFSRALPITSARFLAARAVCHLEGADAVDGIIQSSRLTTDAARNRARQALVSYLAAAILFPYDNFCNEARELRHDIEMLQQRFAASWEQICHRLTTLRRPGQEGIPFHFLRTDIAGNISKRFSASGLQLPRYGGACPRWAIHEAYLTPERVVPQLVQLPDTTQYLFVARAVRTGNGGYRVPQSVHSVMIGCDTAFAHDVVYADGLSLDDAKSAIPVGINCRQCPRTDCLQRAHAPAEPLNTAT
ncbi:helix-turn-helix domain-containing protein [Thalassospira marina]|uniref:XRE family transcriptional regulator n=1 Tax=Thalassospira marina TaxID=2048283 RepID=A0ABM6Q5H3_9PROT|nr:helix-turn-helix transcriptional regulator [Thalassospira marina]AUG51739.1 XRE family transcriptional regulator [Thalassospira marina]